MTKVVIKFPADLMTYREAVDREITGEDWERYAPERHRANLELAKWHLMDKAVVFLAVAGIIAFITLLP